MQCPMYKYLGSSTATEEEIRDSCALSPSAMTYRILVIAEGKHFGLSTACLYVNVGGEYRETGVTEIPRGEYQLELQVRWRKMCL